MPRGGKRPGTGGKRPGAGRKLGSRNKITLVVKDAYVRALDSGKGAEAFFREMKNSKHPEDRRAFLQLAARFIPAELAVSGIPAPPAIQIVQFTPGIIPPPAPVAQPFLEAMKALDAPTE